MQCTQTENKQVTNEQKQNKKESKKRTACLSNDRFRWSPYIPCLKKRSLRWSTYTRSQPIKTNKETKTACQKKSAFADQPTVAANEQNKDSVPKEGPLSLINLQSQPSNKTKTACLKMRSFRWSTCSHNQLIKQRNIDSVPKEGQLLAISLH